MTSKHRSGDRLMVSLKDDSLSRLASRLVAEPDTELAVLVRGVLAQIRQLEILDLWQPQEAAVTYWILMLTGVNQSDEMQIARDVLAWQAFFPKDSARILCIQSSERDAFRCCSSTLGIHDCPTLVMSDCPDMKSYIKIDGRLLRTLVKESGELQRFLAKLHALIEDGQSLADVDAILAGQVFWRGLAVLYKEVKGLVSIKISTTP